MHIKFLLSGIEKNKSDFILENKKYKNNQKKNQKKKLSNIVNRNTTYMIIFISFLFFIFKIYFYKFFYSR